MFNKDSVGLRVICEKYGEGVITRITDTGSLVVKFLDRDDPDEVWYYNANGLMIGYHWDSKRAITLLEGKDSYIEIVEETPKKDITVEEWTNPVAYAVGDIVERKIDSITSLLKVIEELLLPQAIINNKVVALSPEILAEAFWNLDSGEQARFYNHLDTVADFQFPFQLQSITDEDGLTLAGRRVMGCIGEYSHWGLVPKLKYDGSIK